MPFWSTGREHIYRSLSLFRTTSPRVLPIADFIQPVAVITDDHKASVDIEGTSFALYDGDDTAIPATSNAVLNIQAGPAPCFVEYLKNDVSNLGMELHNAVVTVVGPTTIAAQLPRGTPTRVVEFGSILTATFTGLSPTFRIVSDTLTGEHPIPLDHGNGGIFLPPGQALMIIAATADTAIRWQLGLREISPIT